MFQVLAIARYEFKMQWRRRALLVMTLAMLIMTIGAVLLVRGELASQETLSDKADLSVQGLVSLTFIPIGAVLAMVMPFALADVIPKDQQLGVRELIDSTSLPFHTYLAGKVLGAWISVVSSILMVVVPTGVLWWLLVGTFDVLGYIEPWAVGALGMIVINIGLVVLLTSTQPDARRAVIVTLIVIVVIPALIGLDPRANWRDVVNPLRPGLFFHYSNLVAGVSESDTDENTIETLSVGVTILSGLVQVALAAGLAWVWARRRDA